MTVMIPFLFSWMNIRLITMSQETDKRMVSDHEGHHESRVDINRCTPSLDQSNLWPHKTTTKMTQMPSHDLVIEASFTTGIGFHDLKRNLDDEQRKCNFCISLIPRTKLDSKCKECLRFQGTRDLKKNRSSWSHGKITIQSGNYNKIHTGFGFKQQKVG